MAIVLPILSSPNDERLLSLECLPLGDLVQKILLWDLGRQGDILCHGLDRAAIKFVVFREPPLILTIFCLHLPNQLLLSIQRIPCWVWHMFTFWNLFMEFKIADRDFLLPQIYFPRFGYWISLYWCHHETFPWLHSSMQSMLRAEVSTGVMYASRSWFVWHK